MFKRHGVPAERIEVLRAVPFFDGLPKKTLARIDSHVDEVRVPAGRVLMAQGEGSFEAFIVAEGVAEVRVGGEVVAETSIGEMVGEMGVLKNALRSATVVAKTPMRLLVLSSREMGWLFEDPTLAARVEENYARHTRGSSKEQPTNDA